MFFSYITFSLILSVSGGTLIYKHNYLYGGILLAIGLFTLFYTFAYYSKRKRTIDIRKKKNKKKNGESNDDSLEWCIFLDCDDLLDFGDIFNCGGGHSFDCFDMPDCDMPDLDCGGLDCNV